MAKKEEHPMYRAEIIYRQIGLRIQSVRDALGVSQLELSKRVRGLGRTSIANIEAGRQALQLGQLETIAAALHTTPKHLLRGIWF